MRPITLVDDFVCALSFHWKHICLIEAVALSDFCLFSCTVYKFFKRLWSHNLTAL